MILIAGDSWGAGEFTPDYQTLPPPQMISHGGLADYLRQDNYQVLNISSPGGGNWDSILKIIHFFMTNPGTDVSKLFVFQTDWVRDVYRHSTLGSKDRVIGNMFLQPEIHEFRDPGYANEYRDIVLSTFYSKLNKISQMFNVDIYLIGGLSDILLTDLFPNEYPKLTPICQSLVSLALNNDPVISGNNCTTGYIHGDNSKLINFIKRILSSSDQLHELLYQVDLGFTRYETLKKHIDLFPDGLHAGRNVHQALYNLILSKKIL